MPRARNIKPGLYKNADLAECSVWARYLFPGLWMLADREGRLKDRPKEIKGELLPYDSQDVEPLLAELASKVDEQGVPFIVRYQNSDGRFIQISKFKEHQSPHYSEKASVIKPPSLQENGVMVEPISEVEGQTMTGKLQENSRNTEPIKDGEIRRTPVPQPPDSLIHRFSDSPNPDSLNLASLPHAERGDASDSLPEKGRKPTRAIALAVLLRKAGVAITGSHPKALEWANDLKVTDEQALAAVEMARLHKPEPASIPANYFDPILRQVIAEPPAGVNGHDVPRWWESEAGTEKQARLLGMWPARGGESWEALRGRMKAKLIEVKNASTAH